MSAPRLLDKKIINASVAEQQRRRVIEGVNLAKKVDKVRKTLGDEESRLEVFRIDSIKKVQQEIDTKILERDLLEAGNKIFREERLKLQAPIDLAEEYAKAHQETEKNKQWEERNVITEVSLIAREADCEEREKKVSSSEHEHRRKKEVLDRTLEEAADSLSRADIVLENAKQEASEILISVKERERSVKIRENDIDAWNESLARRETKNKDHEIDLENREKALKARYETLVRAQNYIKNKKKQ